MKITRETLTKIIKEELGGGGDHEKQVMEPATSALNQILDDWTNEPDMKSYTGDKYFQRVEEVYILLKGDSE